MFKAAIILISVIVFDDGSYKVLGSKDVILYDSPEECEVALELYEDTIYDNGMIETYVCEWR